MPSRNRTNLLTYSPSDSQCVVPVIDCCNDLPLMGPTSGRIVNFKLEGGDCITLTGFLVPSGAVISAFMLDGGDCGSGLRVPVVRCCAQVAISTSVPTIFLCGPGYFQLDSSAAAGQVLVRGYVVPEAGIHEPPCAPCPPPAPTPPPPPPSGPTADLSIVETISPALFTSGGTTSGTVTMTVTNNGPSAANGAVVTNNLIPS